MRGGFRYWNRYYFFFCVRARRGRESAVRSASVYPSTSELLPLAFRFFPFARAVARSGRQTKTGRPIERHERRKPTERATTGDRQKERRRRRSRRHTVPGEGTLSNSLIILQSAARSVLQGVWEALLFSVLLYFPHPFPISLSDSLSVCLLCLLRSPAWMIDLSPPPPFSYPPLLVLGLGRSVNTPTNQSARSSPDPGRHLIPSRVCSSSPSLPPRFLTRRVSISSPPVRRLSRRWPLASRPPNPRYASPVAASGVQVTEPCSATIAVIPSQCFGVSVHAP